MKRISLFPRWVHRAWAWALGYFWLPCPVCGREFGGHEWMRLNSTQRRVIYVEKLSKRRAVCPACTKTGRGRP